MKLKHTSLLFFVIGALAAPLSFSTLTYQSQLSLDGSTTLYDITAIEFLPSEATLESLGNNRAQAAYSYSFPMETINLHLGDSMALNNVAYCAIDPQDSFQIDFNKSSMVPGSTDQIQLTPTWVDKPAASGKPAVLGWQAFYGWLFGAPGSPNIPENATFPANFPGNTFDNAPAMPLYCLTFTPTWAGWPEGQPLLDTFLIPSANQTDPDNSSYKIDPDDSTSTNDKYPGAYRGTVVFKGHYGPSSHWYSWGTWIPEKTVTIVIPLQMRTYEQGDTSVSFPIDTPTSDAPVASTSPSTP